MIARILVALDGSHRAPGVFEAGVELARYCGATLYPFRAVFVSPEFPAAAAGNPPDRLPQYLLQQATQELGELVSRADRVAVAAPIVRVGHPWRLILEIADEQEVDLIVLGSHGYHGLDRVLGTTAARVANLAHRNVLVVHDHAERVGAQGGAAPAPYR